MSAEHKNYKQYNSGYEIVGNTARKLNTVEKPYFDSDKIIQHEQKKSKQLKLSHDIDLLTMMVLVAAIIAAVYICISYLQVQSDIIQKNKELVVLENRLENVNDANDALYIKINSAIDLEYIYDTAVNKLGMVFEGENERLSYERAYTGYVRQYEIINREDESNLLGRLFK